MRTAEKVGIICVIAGSMAVASYAADQPKLKIESPQNGATISSVPGAGNVVMIRFKTDDFKIVSLRDAMKDSNNQQNAAVQGSTMNESMSATNSSASPAGPAPGGPAPTGAPKQEDLRPSGAGDLPQSDQPATAHAGGAHSGNARSDRGHIHVTLDNQNWFWVHSTNDPIVIAGIPNGQHTVKLELVGNNHAPTGVSETVSFTVGSGTR
jgi:hypothetical protein